MTLFLADISSYEHGLSIADLTDCVGILAKCSEGTYYADADYNGWRTQTAHLGKIFGAYHFISGQDPDAQAAWMAAHIGDKTLPVMLDWEPEGTYKPSLAQLLAVADAMVRHGLRPKLAYAPRWHWSGIGSPDLTGLWARGIGLVSSAYPGGTGTAARLYPGDTAAGWLSYGGMAPMLYQFTDQASDGGQRMDMNAYRGTREQLAAFLGTATPAPAPPASGGPPMPNIPPSIAQKWPELAGDFPPNGTYSNDGAIIWGDAGARAAAMYARQALDAVNALTARIGQPVAVDVAAIASAVAAAIVPHLADAVNLDAIAAAVVAAVETHAPGAVDTDALAAQVVSHIATALGNG